MEVIRGHRALGRTLREPAVAIGSFDGVHLGHQRLFSEIRRKAAERAGDAVVLTFEPHPAKVLAPDLAPRLICPPETRLGRIARAGVDVCIVEPFDRWLAALTPEAFFDQVLVGALGARELCVGFNFTFGKGRAGNTALLAELGRERNVGVTIVPQVTVDGIVCSSTKIREFALEGNVEGAALLLGRDHEVEGVVVRGAGRGRTLGIPTANLRPSTELVPAPGVYAGWARLGENEHYDAAINIGSNPTFGGQALSVEAHLLDFGGRDLYGAGLVLGFRRRLRAEGRFPSPEALVAQIRRDIDTVRSQREGRR